MKRLLNISLAFFLWMAITMVDTYSQITLDHTYTGWASVTNLAVSGYKYHVLDSQAKTLKLYNTNHSLWKTINLSVPAGYTLMTNVYNVSENLFSLDGTVCFSYSYYITTPSYIVETKVIKENGTVLLTVPGATYAYANEVDGESKLFAYITDYTSSTYTTKVYDLPGDFATGIDSDINQHKLPFPNPADQFITIPYSEDLIGQLGKISVNDMQGECLKTYVVDNTFDYLVIRTIDYPSGTYLYKIENSSTETSSGKFVIK
jgi:hypothetical protein